MKCDSGILSLCFGAQNKLKSAQVRPPFRPAKGCDGSQSHLPCDISLLWAKRSSPILFGKEQSAGLLIDVVFTVGDPAILFIGVRNNGDIEEGTNLDSLQRTLSEKLAVVYPPIYYLPKILQHDGKQFLPVIVPGSENRPHFSGQSYVRVGSETKKANESQYVELLAQRQSKAFEILKWKNQDITMERTYTGRTTKFPSVVKVAGCNSFYVTLLQGNDPVSFALTKVEISYDDKEHRLKLQIHEHAV